MQDLHEKDLKELEARIDKFVAEYSNKKLTKKLTDRAAQLMESIRVRKEDNYIDIREALLKRLLPDDMFCMQLKTLTLIRERYSNLERKVLEAVADKKES